MPPIWFDAHLDLACLAVNGRDMFATPEEAGGPWPPGSVTFPSLAQGGVRIALGTIFTEPGGDGPEGYPEGDFEAAARRGRAQIEFYLTARDRGAIVLDLRALLQDDPGVGEVRGGMGVSEHAPHTLTRKLSRATPRDALHLGILIEGADPIASPDELPWWIERGVIAIGLTWTKPSRFAGGNGSPGRGLTGAGRSMVAAMDELGLIHDLSHLSQKATEELLALTDRPVIASHSNCRALLGGKNERHITDETIAEIGRRGGVVGVNLVSGFLDDSITMDSDRRATIDDVVRHIEHICEVMGRRDGVGLGSDMDGGFSALRLPSGIDGPAELDMLDDALESRGWRRSGVDGFRFANFAKCFSTELGAHRAGAIRKD